MDSFARGLLAAAKILQDGVIPAFVKVWEGFIFGNFLLILYSFLLINSAKIIKNIMNESF